MREIGEEYLFAHALMATEDNSHLAEAEQVLKAAVGRDRENPAAWYQLGMANLNLGAIPEAKAAFQGYLNADPNGPKAAEVQAFHKQLP